MRQQSPVTQPSNHPINRSAAVELLRGLVAIPSLSTQEAAACAWLVEQMTGLGYERAYVDEAGNAVGELGPADATQTIVLLGHIDTVPGNILVRIEEAADGPVLYGRGSVDAKGPLATFVAAAARVGMAWAHAHQVRLVVVGAVEEEAATSKGARQIAARFNGEAEPIPAACVIGEPSHWRRVTLGYKGRLLLELEAAQPMAHTAGPDAGVATVAVDLWNWIVAYAGNFNRGRDKAFDQLSPSLRAIHTSTDAAMNERVTAAIGLRLPPDFDPEAFVRDLLDWAAERTGAQSPVPSLQSPPPPGAQTTVDLAGPLTRLTLRLHAHERPWRGERNNGLVRSFLAAIRAVDPEARPGFVVKTGTSDMNVVGPAWGCPILAYGPGDSALDHTPNEHLSLDEYWRAVLVLEEALHNLPQTLNSTGLR
ncbi:MAG: M20/M25/M40 family metallo-hydrolase [Caldilineaceae bacterium]|nr:M20/M25/M40 family metallo-hydrolase [Caldilineaceae bacterium]